jgi:hypothetical protein
LASLIEGIDISAGDVREIIDTALEDGAINAMINVAYRMTLPLVGELEGCGGEGMLDDIQKFLAAHFIALRERRVKMQDVADEYRVEYETARLGEGLRATVYGQTALDLDCTGTLAKLGLKKAELSVYKYADFED